MYLRVDRTKPAVKADISTTAKSDRTLTGHKGRIRHLFSDACYGPRMGPGVKRLPVGLARA